MHRPAGHHTSTNSRSSIANGGSTTTPTPSPRPQASNVLGRHVAGFFSTRSPGLKLFFLFVFCHRTLETQISGKNVPQYTFPTASPKWVPSGSSVGGDSRQSSSRHLGSADGQGKANHLAAKQGSFHLSMALSIGCGSRLVAREDAKTRRQTSPLSFAGT
jgi:hypothetical protein